MWAAAMSTTRKLSLMSGKKAESSTDQRCLHTKRGRDEEREPENVKMCTEMSSWQMLCAK